MLNVKIPKKLMQAPAVYSYLIDLFKLLLKGRNVMMTHNETSLTIAGERNAITLNVASEGEAFMYPTAKGAFGRLPVTTKMRISDYMDKYGEVIQQAVEFASAPTLTHDDVYKFKIDWNKWHEAVSMAIDAFSFDDAADMCNRVGILQHDDDGGYEEIRADELHKLAERMIVVLITLYELNWDGTAISDSNDGGGFKIVTKCHAYRYCDGQYYAVLTLNDSHHEHALAQPHLEIRLVNDIENGLQGFDINLIAVGSFL